MTTPQPAASAAYHCFRCKAPLTTGERACSRCGQPFEAPVPAGPAARPVPVQRRGVGVWIAGGLAVVVLGLAGIGFAGYRAVQNAVGTAQFGRQSSGLHGQGLWSADPAVTAQLGPEQQISGPQGRYSVRPPAGYTLRQASMQANDGTGMVYVWAGPAAADGTFPQFEVMLGGDGGAMTSRLTSAQYTTVGMMSANREHRQIVRSPIQSGSIHGLPFARGYWRGLGNRTGRHFHGMVYTEVAAPNLIMMSGKDSEPGSRASLPLFDAAALSLHKL